MPGNGDEKIFLRGRTYEWLQEYCLDVSIPDLGTYKLAL